MGLKSRLAEEAGCSVEGLQYGLGRETINKQCNFSHSGALASVAGEFESGIGGPYNATQVLTYIPKAGVMKNCYITVYSPGTASTLLTLVKALPPVSLHSGGTVMTSAYLGTAFVSGTPLKLNLYMSGQQNIAAGSLIGLRVNTCINETMGNPYVYSEILL